MIRIQRLDVRGFRGIRQERSLLFEGKSILLFGENGSGKSSFVDALEKLFAGRVSTLDDRAQGLSSDRHGPHILNGGTPTRLQVTFNDRASTGFATGTSVASLPVEAKDYVQAAQENLYTLRRRQVTEFIDSRPQERYTLLRPFLPLSGIEDMESALRTAKDRAQAVAEQARSKLALLANQLQRDLQLPVSSQPPSEEEVVGAVCRTLEGISQPRIAGTREFHDALRRLDEALAPFGDLTRQSNIANAARVLDELRESIFPSGTNELLAALQAFRAKEADEARVFYEVVLEQGARWIEEEKRTTCPLCEHEIVAGTTIAKARERLNSMRQLLELRRRARTDLGQVQQTFRSAIDALERALKQVLLLAADDRGQCEELLTRIRATLTNGLTAVSVEIHGLSIETIEKANEFVRAGASLRESLAGERVRLAERLRSLPSPEAAKAIVSVRDSIRRIKDAWTELGAIRTKVGEAEGEAAVATRLHEDAQAARKEEVQRIFDELSQDIDSLYVSLHPDENHGGVRLEVKEGGQASANLKANFYGRHGQDPRAYYSDAHLDTLGLSIFLALRRWYRKQRPSFDLLVLDDVMTSVDVHHAVRLSELLLHEFKDYQILLTTHDRIWFEHLRDIQARCGVANNFVNKIIHKWSIDDGPDIREPEDERAEIDRLIADGSSQEIAAASGRLLEHVMQEMRYSLRLSVEAKRGEQYELGDLWPAFYATVKGNYPNLYNVSWTTLETLDVLWPLRNWLGAHRNRWAQNVPRSNAVEFATAARDLFDLLYCPSCRRFISPSATPLGQLACRCGKKLYPAAGKQAVQPKSRADLVKETQGALRDAQLDTGLYLAWKRSESGRER